ncbi:DUF418 domain-containing protein [Sphingomonas sp. S1-29]|uniref:DUF418 domain-containing protein n=1 Tax=Sphingomonas sp. S1-29 TaxID=2991074 RepID=UPI0022408F89|nr:DUF418 domain-containing protein [Sphingomonas sp. S1-29]UZK70691.1 DUF418 domain-containing protein [Sphingomonas sp. S1-29]
MILQGSGRDTRFPSLDIVRGVAVLGILTMNIVAFADVPAAYLNPTATGPAGTLDTLLYLAQFVLFDGKMRGLFSVLFGASMLLVIERAQADGRSPAQVHFARMGWLLAFGLAHLYLIWWGDILAQYALVGMIAYAFRRQATHQLIVTGIVLVALQTITMAGLPVAVATAQAGQPDPASAVRTLVELERAFGRPDPAHIAQQLAAYRGSYADAVAFRWRVYAGTPWNALLQNGFETLAYMLFGMAAFRSGLLTGGWERRRLLRLATLSFGISLPIYLLLAFYLAARGFDLYAIVLAVLTLPVPVRPVMIFGWIPLTLLAVPPGSASARRLAATGRMAFSNYIATSLVCTAIFYGHGLALFGRLDRAQLVPVVLLVWALILAWSQPWLQRFSNGPLEWLWRSLARGRIEPLRKVATATQ